MSKTIWSYAILAHTNFFGSNLTEAQMEFIDCNHAIMVNTNLSKANLYYAIMSNANLTKATLIGASLDNTKLTLTNFTDSKLNDAVLTNTIMLVTNLTNSDMENINLAGAFTRDIILTGVKNYPPSEPSEEIIDSSTISDTISYMINDMIGTGQPDRNDVGNCNIS